MTQHDGGPAFPIPLVVSDGAGGSVIEGPAGDYQLKRGFGGMTLRDWFAGQALVGLLTQSITPETRQGGMVEETPEPAYPGGYIDPDFVDGETTWYLARDAYTIADAMLAARGERP